MNTYKIQIDETVYTMTKSDEIVFFTDIVQAYISDCPTMHPSTGIDAVTFSACCVDHFTFTDKEASPVFIFHGASQYHRFVDFAQEYCCDNR